MPLSFADLDTIAGTLRNAFESESPNSVSAVLDAFGWQDLLDSDSAAAVPLVFEVLGSTGVTAAALSDVMASRLRDLIEWPVTVVLPMGASGDQAAGRLVDDTVEVDGICIDDPRSRAVAAVRRGAETCLVVVTVEDLHVTPVAGADPWLRLHRLHGTLRPQALLEPAIASEPWQSAVAWGRIALAAQLVGVARTVLDLANAHAATRVQFGRPVGTFQAVQHHLADLLVTIEAARAAVLDASQADDHLSAMVAKSLAGTASHVAGSNGLQVLAGIGFTWEHPFHRYAKRGVILDRLLGSRMCLPSAIGAHLLRLGTAPRLLEL